MSENGCNVEAIERTFVNAEAKKWAKFRQGEIYLTLQELSSLYKL